MAGYHYVNFDLSAPRYSGRAVSFYIGFIKNVSSNASPAGIHLDGDYSKEKAIGSPVPEHPLARIGDRNHTILRQRFIQDLFYFKPAELGTTQPNDNRFLLIDECDFEDVGGRLVTWTRVYATIPAPRDEWGSRPHAYQYLSSRSPLTVADKVITVTSKIRTDFFHISNLASYPVLIAARFEPMTETLTLKRGATQWNLTGDLFTTTEPEIVAEDSEIGYYHYPIAYRKTPYVPGPTVAFWGDAYAIPGT